ncbi:hypothetical protein ACRE1S_08470, partial [Helicobacter himalayensis]|uniref:hypothetical protein n=1 Tax=Helicobacter himalayensis TaxID=1591088 RepID=UPI003D6EBB62
PYDFAFAQISSGCSPGSTRFICRVDTTPNTTFNNTNGQYTTFLTINAGVRASSSTGNYITNSDTQSPFRIIVQPGAIVKNNGSGSSITINSLRGTNLTIDNNGIIGATVKPADNRYNPANQSSSNIHGANSNIHNTSAGYISRVGLSYGQFEVNNSGVFGEINVSSGGNGIINNNGSGIITMLENLETTTRLSNAGTITTLTNQTWSSTSRKAQLQNLINSGTITTLNNSGDGRLTTFTNERGGSVTTLNNAGGKITNLTNDGTITTLQNTTGRYKQQGGAQVNGQILTLNNNRTITTFTNQANATITGLNNNTNAQIQTLTNQGQIQELNNSG